MLHGWKQPRCLFFFFSSRRRHTRFDCDWSSDVCSSDLPRRVDLSPLRGEPEAVECAARECEPLELVLVEGPAESRLWRGEWVGNSYFWVLGAPVPYHAPLGGDSPPGSTPLSGHSPPRQDETPGLLAS